jgi:hypothetical protein
MEQLALRLAADAGWRWLGGDEEARKPLSVVLRAFDVPVLFACGEERSRPREEDAVRVPVGEGRRLVGRHFFARPVAADATGRVTVRGL